MEELSKQRLFAIFLVAIFLIMAIATLTYTLWLKKSSLNDKPIPTDCFAVTFRDGNEGNMEYTFYQTDEEGLSNTPYEVIITNNCEVPITYNAILNVNETSSLAKDYVKIAVGENVMKLNEVPNISTNSYKINSGQVEALQDVVLNIRAWLGEEVPTNNKEGNTFSYKIAIEEEAYKGND